jgi:hypothetical protein
MSSTGSQDRGAAWPEELETYEPPRIETLGTVTDLTMGVEGAPTGDTGTLSNL